MKNHGKLLVDNGVFKEYEDGYRVASTGATRSSRRGRGRYDLIPPEALRALAIALQDGEIFGERNWEKGMPVSWFIDSMFSHLHDILMGLEGDKEKDPTKENHIDHLVFNACVLATVWKRVKAGKLPKELIDIPGYEKE